MSTSRQNTLGSRSDRRPLSVRVTNTPQDGRPATSDPIDAPVAAVVVGDIEVTRRTAAALTSSGLDVEHLLRPSDDDLRQALHGPVAAVAIVVRGDVAAMRYALLVAHLKPDLPTFVTLFDRTLSEQLASHLPHCTIASPADVTVPAILEACLSPDTAYQSASVALHARALSPSQCSTTHRRTISETDIAPPPVGRLLSTTHAILGQLRSHDRTTRMLLLGLGGLLVVLSLDTAVSSLLWGDSFPAALFNATRVLTTVDSPEQVDPAHPAPGWYHILAALLMLLTLGFTALFTAALVTRASSRRTISMMGRRTKPRSNHVVVVGLGQVGLRLCLALRSLNIPVLAVEQDPHASNFRLAKAAGIPVLIAHGQDRQILETLSLHRARAIAAMASNDLDNVEVALAARAVAPGLRVVVRAGEDPLITETSSLLRIGHVIDVSTATAEDLGNSIRALVRPTTVVQ